MSGMSPSLALVSLMMLWATTICSTNGATMTVRDDETIPIIETSPHIFQDTGFHTLSFRFTPPGELTAWRDLLIDSARKLHIVILSESLTSFQHIHPLDLSTPEPSSTMWNITAQLPFKGRYRILINAVDNRTGIPTPVQVSGTWVTVLNGPTCETSVTPALETTKLYKSYRAITTSFGPTYPHAVNLDASHLSTVDVTDGDPEFVLTLSTDAHKQASVGVCSSITINVRQMNGTSKSEAEINIVPMLGQISHAAFATKSLSDIGHLHAMLPDDMPRGTYGPLERQQREPLERQQREPLQGRYNRALSIRGGNHQGGHGSLCGHHGYSALDDMQGLRTGPDITFWIEPKDRGEHIVVGQFMVNITTALVVVFFKFGIDVAAAATTADAISSTQPMDGQHFTPLPTDQSPATVIPLMIGALSVTIGVGLSYCLWRVYQSGWCLRMHRVGLTATVGGLFGKGGGRRAFQRIAGQTQTPIGGFSRFGIDESAHNDGDGLATGTEIPDSYGLVVDGKSSPVSDGGELQREMLAGRPSWQQKRRDTSADTAVAVDNMHEDGGDERHEVESGLASMI